MAGTLTIGLVSGLPSHPDPRAHHVTNDPGIFGNPSLREVSLPPLKWPQQFIHLWLSHAGDSYLYIWAMVWLKAISIYWTTLSVKASPLSSPLLWEIENAPSDLLLCASCAIQGFLFCFVYSTLITSLIHIISLQDGEPEASVWLRQMVIEPHCCMDTCVLLPRPGLTFQCSPRLRKQRGRLRPFPDGLSLCSPGASSHPQLPPACKE